MVDVVITYETLFDILRKEKSKQDLQQLPGDFYGQLVAYLRQKKADVEAAGGFSAPGAQKALIQYKNVQKILRELYERRERKIIEMALNRARSESNIVDTTPLLREEKSFFEECATLLGQHKTGLLSLVLEGEAPEGTIVPEPSSETEEETESTETPKPTSDSAAEPADPSPPVPGEEREEAPSVDISVIASQDACAVRFVAPVPKFLGLKGEVHGPFSPGDAAELPGKIAAVLLKKKRVEVA